MKVIIQTLVFLFLSISFFVQCKKDEVEQEEIVETDPIITGNVFAYNGYGSKVSLPSGTKAKLFTVDTLGNIVLEYYKDISSNGSYTFSEIERGVYNLLVTAEGYGDCLKENISFDSLSTSNVPNVALCTYANGEAQLKSIGLSGLDVGIIDLKRELVFTGNSSSNYSLKTRYLFSLDPAMSEESIFYTYTSGLTEGQSGTVDVKTTRFGLVNLQTFIDDSTDVYISVAVETPYSTGYFDGDMTVYPNIKYPLPTPQKFLYYRPIED